MSLQPVIVYYDDEDDYLTDVNARYTAEGRRSTPPVVAPQVFKQEDNGRWTVNNGAWPMMSWPEVVAELNRRRQGL